MNQNNNRSTMTRVVLRGKVLSVIEQRQEVHQESTGSYLAIPRAVTQLLDEFVELKAEYETMERELKTLKEGLRVIFQAALPEEKRLQP